MKNTSRSIKTTYDLAACFEYSLPDGIDVDSDLRMNDGFWDSICFDEGINQAIHSLARKKKLPVQNHGISVMVVGVDKLTRTTTLIASQRHTKPHTLEAMG